MLDENQIPLSKQVAVLQERLVEEIVQNRAYLHAMAKINEIVSPNPEHTSLESIIAQIEELKSKARRFDMLMASRSEDPFNSPAINALKLG